MPPGYSLRRAPGYACTVVLTLALSLAMLLLVCLLNYQVLERVDLCGIKNERQMSKL